MFGRAWTQKGTFEETVMSDGQKSSRQREEAEADSAGE